MLHRLLSSLLILSILASGFGRMVVQAGYEMNRAYIAKELCINRTKPMLHCNGKCYLSKKIKQLEETQQKQERFKPMIYDAFVENKASFKCFTVLLDELLPSPASRYSFVSKTTIFHPPPAGRFS